jgi:hypothetical protein
VWAIEALPLDLPQNAIAERHPTRTAKQFRSLTLSQYQHPSTATSVETAKNCSKATLAGRKMGSEAKEVMRNHCSFEELAGRTMAADDQEVMRDPRNFENVCQLCFLHHLRRSPSA